MIDLSRAILVANLYRHGLNSSCRTWAQQFCPGRDFGVRGERMDLLSYRNRVVRDIVLKQPSEIEWAVFLDNDVTITCPGVDRFLVLDADVASCEFSVSPQVEPWARPDSFHTTFWFARIEVFRRIPPPWFAFGYSADGCDMEKCECMVFAEKVLAAGFSIAHGGHCGHACEGKWCG